MGGLLDLKTVRSAAELVTAAGCRQVGIDANHHQLEYPVQAMLLDLDPDVRFAHVGVENPSERYRPLDEPAPCAVVCLGCKGDANRLRDYGDVGIPHDIGNLFVFVGPQ